MITRLDVNLSRTTTAEEVMEAWRRKDQAHINGLARWRKEIGCAWTEILHQEFSAIAYCWFS